MPEVRLRARDTAEAGGGDGVQGAACGHPLHRRGVTGMFSLRPSLGTYARLVDDLRVSPDLWDVTKTRQ